MTTMKKKRERHRSLTRAALRASRVINQLATDKYEQIVKGDLHAQVNCLDLAVLSIKKSGGGLFSKAFVLIS